MPFTTSPASPRSIPAPPAAASIPETDSAYRKVSTPLQFAEALYLANKNKGVKVIEIMNDLDLGWNEVGPEVREMASTPFVSAIAPKLHPVLLATGVSSITINPKKGGLTIFSANGAAIRHCIWSIKATSNIIIRNLSSTIVRMGRAKQGDYDKNNWDFITLGVGGGTVHHVWIDHCTFTKAYDAIIDTKGGAANVTYSWNKYVGDDGATNPNSFVWQQINALEANRTAHLMYDFLRARGFSTADIVTILQGPGKLHAIGELSLDPVNVNSTVTFHRSGIWHGIGCRAGRRHGSTTISTWTTPGCWRETMRDSIAATMSVADQHTLNNTYSFKPPINGSISTENGAMLVEKSVYIDCLWPLRNNQTDPSNPIYTGKIMATDTVYLFHETDGSTTQIRGDSTDPNNPLGPFQAPIIPFSWNTADGSRPYPPPPMDDPNDLESIVTSPTAGAGAGVITWDRPNWLKTAYRSPPCSEDSMAYLGTLRSIEDRNTRPPA
jgi:pectate lyase